MRVDDRPTDRAVVDRECIGVKLNWRGVSITDAGQKAKVAWLVFMADWCVWRIRIVITNYLPKRPEK